MCIWPSQHSYRPCSRINVIGMYGLPYPPPIQLCKLPGIVFSTFQYGIIGKKYNFHLVFNHCVSAWAMRMMIKIYSIAGPSVILFYLIIIAKLRLI